MRLVQLRALACSKRSFVRAIATALAVLCLADPSPALAQLRLSEVASVSQTIDGTTIRIDYSRPRARGRVQSQLFGQKLPWGEPWTPGANMATTIAVTKEVLLNGHRLAQGTYSIWMIPRESGIWTVVLDPKARRYHAERPDSTADQVRFAVTVAEGPLTPTLTWTIPQYRPDSTVITMQWFTTRVSLWVKVTPSLSAVISESEARPFLGRYQVTCHLEIAEICFRDAVGSDKATMSISRNLGRLEARFDSVGRVPRMFYLVPIAPELFLYGWCCSSTEGDVHTEPRDFVVFEFRMTVDRVPGFEVRNHADVLIATGERLPGGGAP